MKIGNTFSYDPQKKQFHFDDVRDYQWAKATVTSLSIWRNLNDAPIGPFQVFYSDTKHLLVLQDLSVPDETRIVDLFELNNIKQIEKRKHKKASFTVPTHFAGLFFSSKKPPVETSNHNKPVTDKRKP